ncbi:MAG: hypothetical protein NVS3B12_27660 [Acidimicrobiales bacterium]
MTAERVGNVRLVAGMAGWDAKVFVDGKELTNVVRAEVKVDPTDYVRVYLELCDVDIEVATDEAFVDKAIVLPSTGNVRLTLTHDEAVEVLARRGTPGVLPRKNP